MTASAVEICSQNPRRLPKRNSVTVSWPGASGGICVVYLVCAPIQRSSAVTLSKVVGADAVMRRARTATLG